MLCFTIHGIKFCLPPVYYYPIIWWHLPGPDPGPERRWLPELPGVENEVMLGAVSLAAIGVLAAKVQPELRREIDSVVEKGFELISARLPEHIDVSFGGARGFQ
jgi:hypothetical protein